MHIELITCTPDVSAPAQSWAQSFTWCSPPAPHAHLGSKLGAQSCRTDHFRWFRLVGDPRLFTQSSRDRSTERTYYTPSSVVQTTLGGSDSCAGIVSEMEIWALDSAVQVTLGDSSWQISWHWFDISKALAFYLETCDMAYFGAWFIYICIFYFSGKYTGFTARG